MRERTPIFYLFVKGFLKLIFAGYQSSKRGLETLYQYNLT